jgi:hypothetical protein
VHGRRSRVGDIQNGIFRKTELIEIGPQDRIAGAAFRGPARLQDVSCVKSDIRLFAHEPPGAGEPGKRTRRSALRPIGHNRIELLGADLRSDADAREQLAAFAPEFHRRAANRQRLGFGPKAFDVAELKLTIDGDQT